MVIITYEVLCGIKNKQEKIAKAIKLQHTKMLCQIVNSMPHVDGIIYQEAVKEINNRYFS